MIARKSHGGSWDPWEEHSGVAAGLPLTGLAQGLEPQLPRPVNGAERTSAVHLREADEQTLPRNLLRWTGLCEIWGALISLAGLLKKSISLIFFFFRLKKPLSLQKTLCGKVPAFILSHTAKPLVSL